VLFNPRISYFDRHRDDGGDATNLFILSLLGSTFQDVFKGTSRTFAEMINFKRLNGIFTAFSYFFSFINLRLYIYNIKLVIYNNRINEKKRCL